MPGRWVFDAQFIATSMVECIALAGDTVRNSILPMDFTTAGACKGKDVHDPVRGTCKARTLPSTLAIIPLSAASEAGGIGTWK